MLPGDPPPGSPPPSQDPRFRAIFDAEARYVWTTLRRLGVSPADLDDVTQEVLLRVYRQLDQYDSARPLRPWLFGIAHRVASEWRRYRRRHPERPEDSVPEAVDSTPGADETVAAQQARTAVLRALDALEEDRRAVFILHELDGVAIPEVATALGIPLNTAYSRLRLAREDFRGAVTRLRHQGVLP